MGKTKREDFRLQFGIRRGNQRAWKFRKLKLNDFISSPRKETQLTNNIKKWDRKMKRSGTRRMK